MSLLRPGVVKQLTHSLTPLFAEALSQILTTFLIINQMKRVILCCKEHDKSLIRYYYAYDISKAILDLDLDFVSKFSFPCNSVNSAHRDMHDTSSESCAQGLYFFYINLKVSSNLWGRYDIKPEKSRLFPCNRVISSCRIMCNASIESSHPGLHFVFLY